MAHSRFYYPAKGTDYPIAFLYQTAAEIGVTVQGEAVAWSLLNPGTVRLTEAPFGVVCVYSKDPLKASADDHREALGAGSDGRSFDAHHYPIHHVAEPVEPADAATKAYVDAAIKALGQQMLEDLVAAIEQLNGNPK